MVYYIRFLNGPTMSTSHGPQITGTIAISSDLRERLYSENVVLVISSKSEQTTTKLLEWKSGMHALKFQIPFESTSSVPNILVRISIQGQNTWWKCSQGTQPKIIPIVPVCSTIVSPNINDDFFTRFIQLGPTQNQLLELAELKRESIAGHIWDAGFVLVNKLAEFLSDPKNPVHINVLELGCGTGLISLALAILLPNCTVTMTDLPDAADLVSNNIACNKAKFAPGSRANFQVLEWANHPDWLVSSTHHLIIVGDCTYNPDSAQDLLTTLDFVLGPNSVILLASKKRHNSENAFDDMLADYNIIEQKRQTIELQNEPHSPCELVYIKTLCRADKPHNFPKWTANHPLKKVLIADN